MNEVKLWDSVLNSAMKLPFVNVDRNDFLSKELAVMCSSDQIDAVLNGEKRISDFLAPNQVEKLANGSIKYHLTVVTSTSTLAGLPGGWTMAASIPADIAQFFGHVLCLSQKLLYLYDWPDLNDGSSKLTEEANNILTIFVGIMFGCQIAEGGIKNILSMLAKGVPQEIAKNAITKSAVYQLAKQVAKFLGIKLTRDGFLRGVGKVIPLLGAPISGGITYFTFRPMAYRLKKYLKENPYR